MELLLRGSEQLSCLNGKYEHLTNTLAAIQLQLLNMGKEKVLPDEESILGVPYPGSTNDRPYSRFQQSPKPRMQIEHSGGNIISPLPKIDFPKFDGTHPRAWILKCNGYFKLIPNIPDDQKVILASMHFKGKAALWFQNFNTKQLDLTWAQFLEVVSSRFEELRETKIIGEFNKLRHSGSYSDYVERFEELRACMLMLNGGDYSEEYFIASFISGLSEESQAFINMFEPSTLQQTIELGRKQLCTIEALSKKLKGPARPVTSSYSPSKRIDTSPWQPPKTNMSVPSKQPIKLLSAAEMAARREKGLCYNCDEQFTFGHRCKQRSTYMIMTEEEELDYLHSANEGVEDKEKELEQMEEIQMSLNAISGEDGLTTMRLVGDCDGHKLHILIDSGSTLSFLQESTAQKLGWKLEPIEPFGVLDSRVIRRKGEEISRDPCAVLVNAGRSPATWEDTKFIGESFHLLILGDKDRLRQGILL
ncbi:hypothetical protein DH2020_037582 [Rehmannia glutinosa]|uniref:Ty3 transposon capsid-like protein domain-containing protein n=1 Tax=Rehmannia glutinosa TaxID=99300 RepID=A0ABR0V2H3_REHGL